MASADPILAQTQAIISTAHATWFAGAATSVAAIATLGTVLVALWLPRQQRLADQALHEDSILLETKLALTACRNSIRQIKTVAFQIAENPNRTFVDAAWRDRVRFGMRVVEQFLDRRLHNLEVVMLLLDTQAILERCASRFEEIESEDGVSPPHFTLSGARPAFVNYDLQADALVNEIARIEANL